MVALLLAAALVFSGSAGAAEGTEDVRLHVVAAGNSGAEQNQKLLVRNGVRAVSRLLLLGCGDADEAWARLKGFRGLLWLSARASALLAGCRGPVALQMGEFDFPARTYGKLTLPAGSYRAVRVVLGEGTGRNWWCVLYPSLCLPQEGEPRYRSVVWDWLVGLWKAVRG